MLNIFLKTEVIAASYEIDQVTGNSEQLKARLRRMGGKLTDDDLDVVPEGVINSSEKPGELRYYQVRGWK